MDYREKAFVSAIIYTKNDSSFPKFLKFVSVFLEHKFENYEVIVVDDYSELKIYEMEKAAVSKLSGFSTIIRLARTHGAESALLAGLDKSIGDYVFQFNTVHIDYTITLLEQMFEISKQGIDIISACPKLRKLSSSFLFYRFLNAVSYIDYKFTTERVMLISRRALNSLLAVDEYARYTKALLYMSGFSKQTLDYKPMNRSYRDKRSLTAKIEQGLTIVISYSKLGTFFPLGIAAMFFLISLFFLGFGLYSNFIAKDTVTGWFSIVGIITVSFSGLFFVLGILGHYLSKIAVETTRLPLYSIEEQTSNFQMQ